MMMMYTTNFFTLELLVVFKLKKELRLAKRILSLRDHPLFSAFSQEYREYARGEGVNPVVRFQKCWS